MCVSVSVSVYIYIYSFYYYTYSLSLFISLSLSIGQPELAEKFVVKALSLLSYASVEVGSWKRRMEDTYLKLLAMQQTGSGSGSGSGSVRERSLMGLQ